MKSVPDPVRSEAAAAADLMLQVTIGYIPSMCLNVVAKLGVADHLTKGPKTVADLAALTSSNEDVLYRVLRALSTLGIFQEMEGRRFAQTPASDLLSSQHPQSLRAAVAFLPDPFHFRCYANLMHSVKTGETVVGPTHGKPLFDYLKDEPEESEVFNAAMVNGTQFVIPAVLQAYDFSGIHTLVDVGGGHGSVLASILQQYPEMNGILYDLDHVVAGAPSLLERSGVSKRCRILTGSFFESVPAGGDAYIMKNIIHDWDDERCVVILKNIKRAMGNQANGKILIIDSVVPGGPEPHPSKWFDIEMLALPGGRERTQEEFRQLFSAAGLNLVRAVPTASMVSVVEAR